MSDQELRELARKAVEDKDVAAAELLAAALKRTPGEASAEATAFAFIERAYLTDVEAVAEAVAKKAPKKGRPFKNKSATAQKVWDAVTEALRSHPRVREPLPVPDGHPLAMTAAGSVSALLVLAVSRSRGSWRAYFVADEIAEVENVYPQGHVGLEVEHLAAVVMQEDVVAQLRLLGVLELVPDAHQILESEHAGPDPVRRPPRMCSGCGTRPVRSQSSRCRVCSGLSRSPGRAATAPQPQAVQTCPACGGTGQNFANGNSCTDCRGTGAFGPASAPSRDWDEDPPTTMGNHWTDNLGR